MCSFCYTSVVNGAVAVVPLVGWDTILDPDDDCEIKSTITITVPKSHHDLNPQVSRGHKMNAPRLLKNVTGDFTAQVCVTSDFDPTIGSGGYLAAGLVIWEDEFHFLRFERSAIVSSGELQCAARFELWRNGKFIGLPPTYKPIAEFFEQRSAWLKIQRKDERLIASISHDGEEWKAVKERKDLFAVEVSVGLMALNMSNAEFSVDFDLFDIVFH